MKNRLQDAEISMSVSDKAVKKLRKLIEKGKIEKAWDEFTEGEVSHPEDYYYVEAHEIEIPS